MPVKNNVFIPYTKEFVFDLGIIVGVRKESIQDLVLYCAVDSNGKGDREVKEFTTSYNSFSARDNDYVNLVNAIENYKEALASKREVAGK